MGLSEAAYSTECAEVEPGTAHTRECPERRLSLRVTSPKGAQSFAGPAQPSSNQATPQHAATL